MQMTTRSSRPFQSATPEEYEVYMNSKYSTDSSGVEPSADYGKKLQSAIEHKRALYKEYYSKSNAELISEYRSAEEQFFISSYSPVVLLHTNRQTILRLAEDDRVVSITKFIEDQPLNESLQLANDITRAGYVKNEYSNTGSGVKIGQIEKGVPKTPKEDNYLDGASITLRSGDSSNDHATLVARILVGTDPTGVKHDDGLAPDAELYSCAIAHVSEFFAGVEWLLDQGVNIINMSISLPYGAEGSYDNISRWVDSIAYRHDVHIVKAAGNSSTYITCPGMAYNVITVGGLDNKGSAEVAVFDLPGFSNYEECKGCRAEKPNLVAPAVVIFDDNGTSFAAPQVTGTIAQLCSYCPALKVQQAALGAILAASSANKVESIGRGGKGDAFTKSVQVDANRQISDKEGAGILDARWARGIVYYKHYWSCSVEENSFPYDKYVTIDASANSVTRVALFWLQNGPVSGSSQVSNLDLFIYGPDGKLVGSSETKYSNFEIVQFEPSASGEYKISITISGGSTVREYIGIAVW